MSYYRTCPICGATLDPSEQCECMQKKRTPREWKRNGVQFKSLGNSFMCLLYHKQKDKSRV